ncbi:MAG TPA: hypothetical protein VHZ64_07230 [Xanthobacteraceae bacterium]|nr:hypothetical protein [Xanthobacteraceae bacterium]
MDADVAEQLRALARRVRHNVPHHRDPERFHVEKSEIEHALGRLAAHSTSGAFSFPGTSLVDAEHARKSS